MKCMETRVLSAKDICQIIGKCKDSGVEFFKHADIEIKFHPNRNEDAPTSRNEVAGTNETLPMIEPTPIGNSAPVIKEMEERALDDAFEAQAMVDDPFVFEQAIVTRDIERQRELNG